MAKISTSILDKLSNPSTEGSTSPQEKEKTSSVPGDLSNLGVVKDRQTQGPPGSIQPWGHQTLPSPSQHPLPTARVADTPGPVDISSPPLGIRPLTSTGLFSPPTSLPSVTLPSHPPLSPITSGQDFFDAVSVIQTPEWDNYDSSPTFNLDQNFWQSRKFSDTDPAFLDLREPRKVQLVDTIYSELDSVSEVAMSPPGAEAKEGKDNTLQLQEQRNMELDQLATKVNTDIKRLKLLTKTFTAANVNPSTVYSVDQKLKEIRDLLVDIWADVEDMCSDYEEELGSKAQEWQDHISIQNNLVNQHETEVRAKVLKLMPPPTPLTAFEQESLRIQKAAADAQKALVDLEIDRRKRDNRESEVKVNSKSSEFRGKVRLIEGHIKLVETRDNMDYWKDADDDTISAAMKELDKWDIAMAAAEQNFLEFDQLVMVYGEPRDSADNGYDYNAIKDLLLELRVDFKDARSSVILEDKQRGLYSLNKTTGEVLKYPTFSGEPGQDLVKFKEKVVYRFKRNQVSKLDQLEKLRETLKGQALRLVPDSMKDIDAAWAALEDAFGDSSRILQHRLSSLKKLGDLPAESVKGLPNFENRVEYLLKFENIVEDIIELGKSDEDLYLLSFNANTVAEVVNKFPNSMVLKLNKLPGRGKDKLINILAKIKEFRADAQSLQKTRSLNTPAPAPQNPPKREKEKQQANLTNGVSAQVMYNPPRREPACRVCCHLRDVTNAAPAPNTVFYEDHICNYVTGCPQFINMDMTARLKIATDIKLCHKCFHPEVQYSKDHDQECSVNKDKKHGYSCTKCKMHSWICKYHKVENKTKLDKFKKEYREKFKIRLVFTASLLSSEQAALSVDSVSSEQQAGQGITPGANVPVTVIDMGVLEANPAATGSEEQSAGVVGNFAYSANLQAMKKRLRQAGFKGEINPPPEGEPMFLFQAIQGRTEAVNTFYDNGCSHAVFREGVPSQQLRARITQKGPFHMNGVGGIVTKANDQWLAALDTEDGNKQLVCGLTVDVVTANFPLIDVSAAVQEVKQDKPNDKFLQSCTLPKMAGGVTDILLGVMYSKIFPIMVHQLPCGLAIYKCVLASHNNKYNCLIGGPHKSFEVVAGQAGGAPALLSHFVQGLQNYRAWGPPKISCAPLTLEDEKFAKEMNCAEGDTKEFHYVKQMDEIDVLVENMLGCDGGDAEAVVDAEDLGVNDPPPPSDCECSLLPMCCSNMAKFDTFLATTDQDQIKYLKQLLLSQDFGLSVEYRCVRCRECWACKNADETEKISLREEQENQLIRESVKLNFENKSIDCTLPVRGDEADFLSTNKDLALKVLKSVCNRYHKDATVKPVILAAFQKLFDKGFAKFMHQLTDEEQQKFANKDPQYFIPWRVVFADSVTTPCRPVMDASSRTRKRADGSGGRCLNDLVVKGVVNSLDLLRLVLRWQVGHFAMSGDLAQFYNSFKLGSKQWNLQRFLWQDDLNPDAEVMEGVITTLIYGVKSVSAQSEDSIKQLAEAIRPTNPVLADFLLFCLYVDDMGESKATEEECRKLAALADQVFAMVGLECKGWTFSFSDPPERVAKTGHCIKIGGLIWTPKVEAVEVPIPKLHFSRRSRGRLDDNTSFFEGEFGDLDKFVPIDLSRRMVASKLASIYDIVGKFVPIMIGLKADLRDVVINTMTWDEPMSLDLRNKWLENFWKVEQLRGIQFTRPRMPETAVSTKMRLITGVDAALLALIMGCWGCFKLRDGSWSCQFIIGRGLLAPPNGTIPKNELESLCGGSNLSWVVRKALGDWVDSQMVVGDSIIALCWTTSENKRLSMFHRNRVIQIRRGTSLEELYHVKTSENPSDIGTRPSKVTIQDVGPDSMWENGTDWMHGDISDAVQDGILIPAQELRLNKENEEEFSRGLIFDSQIPEVITRGHVVNPNRLSLIEQRAEFSDYLILPTKFNFQSVVRIYGYVMTFIAKCRAKKLVGPLLGDGELKFTAFSCVEIGLVGSAVQLVEQDQVSSGDQNSKSLVSAFTASLNPNFVEKYKSAHTDRQGAPVVTDKFINMALTYLFRKATAEVKEFSSAKTIKNHMVEKDGILLSKNRLLDCLDYTYTGELKVDLGSLGVKANTPVLDRYSPLAYAVAQHVHWKLSPHRGIETHNRVALEHVHIQQAMSLFRELSMECIRCFMRRKRMLEVSMGGLSKYQLIVAPPFWVAQMDLFGPYYVFVPGYERETRSRQMKEAKVWVMCSVCPTSRLVNLQVIEKSDAGGIICGVTRLACEVGLPKFFLVDQHDATMCALANSELDYRDLQLQLHRQFGIIFEHCPVGGHDSHGKVERVIKSVQQGLNDCGLKTYKLHATGLQTLCKIVENAYNSVPIGYSYDRDRDNTSVLKIICPNMLRMGRTNKRTLDGPIRLARGTRELLTKVEELYDAWFKVWQDAVVPKLIFQPKWYDSDRDLQEGDLVYFQKSESKLDNKWQVGKVEQIVRGRDQKIRKVIVKYRNASEENVVHLTDRSVRKLVKLFSIDEYQIQNDLTELQKRIDQLQDNPAGQVDDPVQVEGGGDAQGPVHVDDGQAGLGAEQNDEEDENQLLVGDADQFAAAGEDAQEETGDEQHAGVGDGPQVQEVGDQPAAVDDVQHGGQDDDDVPAANTRSKRRCNCCCLSHCRLSFHTMGANVRAYSSTNVFPSACEMGTFTVDMEVVDTDSEVDYMEEEVMFTEAGSITEMLKSFNFVM